MGILYSIIYGIVSGLAEFLPISAQAHQILLQRLFGKMHPEPMRDLLVHLGFFVTLLVACRGDIKHWISERRLLARSRHRRVNNAASHGMYDFRIVQTATVPLALVLILASVNSGGFTHYLYLALFFIINGIFLYIPEHIRQGNKDARHMTGLDGVLIGTLGGLSAFCGISRMGMCISAATLRGADKKNAVNWSLLLGIPALIILCVFDVIGIASVGLNSIGVLDALGYMISALLAFGAGYGGISFMRFLAVRDSFSGFAYYSWGAAIFSVILYLIT